MAFPRRLFLWLALFFSCGAAAAPGGQVQAASSGGKRGPAGAIRGKVRPASLLQGNRVTFLVDGTRRRPRVDHGQFTLPNVPAGQHTLSILDNRTGKGKHVSVKVRNRSTARVGSLALQSGGQIAGIVSKLVAPFDGGLEPLGGIEVVVEPDTGGNGGGVSPKNVLSRLVATTDEGGSYLFKAVPPGSYRVSVVVPGLEAGVNFAYVEVGRSAVADFQLREVIEEGVGTVEGAITDANGNPVVGAMVTIYSYDIYYPPYVDDVSETKAARLGKSARAASRSLPHGAFSTLTNKNGRYSLNVPSGYLHFEAWADGFSPVQAQIVLRADTTLTKNATLERYEPPTGAVLDGAVYDAESGEPIAGAKVSIGVAVPMGGKRPDSVFSAVTGKDGTFHFENVPAGAWTVWVAAERHAEQSAEVWFEDGMASYQEFYLERLKR